MSESTPGHLYSVMYDGKEGRGPPPSYLPLHYHQSREDYTNVRIGVFHAWLQDADIQVQQECYKVIQYMQSKGAVIVNITIPHMMQLSMAHGLKISSEFAIGWDYAMSMNPRDIEPATKITASLGGTVTALEILAAEKIRNWGYKYVKELYRSHKLTCIVAPTVSILPPVLTNEAKVVGESNTGLVMQVVKHVFLGNFLGLPAYSVPIAWVNAKTEGSEHPLPIGLLYTFYIQLPIFMSPSHYVYRVAIDWGSLGRRGVASISQ